MIGLNMVHNVLITSLLRTDLANPCPSLLIVYSIFALYRDTKNYTFDYDDMAGYLQYIQLQFSIEPSEGSWRSKENIFSESKDLDS